MTVDHEEDQRTNNWWQSKSKDYLYSFLCTPYDGHGNPARVWLQEHLRGRVLDCGCWAGVDSEHLQSVCDYTGMDAAPKMIELCREPSPEG